MNFLNISSISSFISAHPIAFVSALFAQLLLVLIFAIAYIRGRTKEHDSAVSGGVGKKFGVLEVVTLIIAPAISAFAFVYVAFLTISTQSVADTRSKAAQETVPMVTIAGNTRIKASVASSWQQLLAAVPTNPTAVTATASAGNKVIALMSDNTYPYQRVTFTWTGDQAREPGTKIVGYFVYFGPQNTEIPFPLPGYETSVDPKTMGVRVSTNSYTTPNLAHGQTYYLYVQSISDSKNSNPYYKFGMLEVGYLETLSAKKLFTYRYE